MIMSSIRFTCIFFLFALSTTPKDVYAATISGMGNLLELEYHFLDNLKDYVARELAKHQRISLLLKDFENENAKALNNSLEYLSSPINVFKLIKRSVVDFKDAQHVILERNNEEEYDASLVRIQTDTLLAMHVANESDLERAAMGLDRLQRIYELNTSDLAEGRILGVQYSAAMSASDSYYLAEQLYDTQNYERSLEWFSDAWQKLHNRTADEWDFIPKDTVTLLEQYSAAAYNAGKLQMALDLVKQILLVDPDNAGALADMKEIQMKMFKERNSWTMRKQVKKVERSLNELFEATCRGELRQTSTEQRSLRCMYVNNSVPFLKIAPFKLEQLSLEPLIVYYHDVIYENEIAQVLQTTAPYEYTNSSSAHVQALEVRTVKTATLNFEKYDFLHNIQQRLLDMTHLSLKTGQQDMYLEKYGTGERYDLQYDFSPPSTSHSGNPIATTQFYISDVDLGGATAFPFLKLAVKPIRGSLLFWYNLHDSTDPDYRMKYDSCPVLKGSKWVLNKWIHEQGQEFMRPCGLKSTANLSAEYIRNDK